MEKKNTELEKLFQQENVYPVKKKAIPMLKGFQDGKPVFEDLLRPPLCLAEQVCQKWHKSSANQGNTATCHQLLHSLRFC